MWLKQTFRLGEIVNFLPEYLSLFIFFCVYFTWWNILKHNIETVDLSLDFSMHLKMSELLIKINSWQTITIMTVILSLPFNNFLMQIKRTSANDKNQQQKLHLGRELPELERTFTVLSMVMMRQYYCSSPWMQILYAVLW